MTLQEFFNFLVSNPVWIISYFLLIPFTAWLAGIFGKGEGNMDPWKYLYSALIYLVCVPGIFAIFFNLYLFIFERRSIFQTEIFTQLLPIVSMFVTLLLIRRNVSLDLVPGFDKITGLFMMITAAFAFFWVLDKTHLIVISYLPLWQGLLIFAGLLLVMRWGWGRLAKKPA
ncbi:MAG: hypothetical protein K9J37_23630 [Saprospiraceae bacterium]|nr:hypothetical protein [Saprospiraceae bacterium]MCF8252918.1 hypothetical protein [Saprospiraceae bacterium]MCF8313780.1 hypothetical protein [Saprospiraceae bacterium]MCF8442486.1 hypothetical protein [Saprospiraceae bacterium]